jgi:hypothetical protein
MLKASLITLNLIALLAVKIFFGGAVSVEQKLPESINQGEKFMVEIKINKSDREGFAKWQQKLPEGFIATPKETSGGTFSFKNQDVKLIWMALPKKEEIIITYEVEVDPILSGEFTLDGKFSFIDQNERKDINSGVSKITIKSINEDATADNFEEKTESSSDTSDEITEQTIEPEEIVSTENQNTSSQGKIEGSKTVTNSEGIKIEREIIHSENGKYIVKLIVAKADFNSFGKIEEYIPEGFIVSEIENEKGIFSFENQVLKVLWMALPKKSNLEISYNLIAQDDLLSNAQIHGMFSFLNIDESMQLEMKASKFKNYFKSEEQLAEEVNTIDNSLDEKNKESEMAGNTQSSEESNDEKEESDNNIAENNTITENSETEQNLTNSITNIPSPETSISYKVQIAAGRKEVQKEYFQKNNFINESVSIEYHNNWYKYTLGKYDIYKQARDKRNEVWAAENKITDAFVTAYNAGERVTVQEALMISKQKWYK